MFRYLCLLFTILSYCRPSFATAEGAVLSRGIKFERDFLTYALNGFEPVDNDPQLPYKFPKKSAVELDSLMFGECMAQAVLRRFPNEYRFVPDINMTCRDTHGELVPNPYSQFEDGIIDYLAAYPSRACDYTSGNEDKLLRWIKQQPDNSINPTRLFEESLILNKGRVWETLICIHNVVRKYARFESERYRSTNISRKSAEAFFNKFIDIRGDLASRGPGFVGDHRGSWYRMWGAMIYKMRNIFETGSFTASSQTGRCSVWRPTPNDRLSEIYSDGASIFAFFYDEWIGKIADEPDRYKFHIDKNSALAINSLSDHLRKEPQLSSSQLDCDKLPYLVPRPDPQP